MSRSRRKTPVMGITKAESEKRDKVLAHRRQRRRVHTALASGVAEVITRRKAGEVWSVATDGQPRFDPRRWPQLMRT
jgi:Lhr-like helicase